MNLLTLLLYFILTVLWFHLCIHMNHQCVSMHLLFTNCFLHTPHLKSQPPFFFNQIEAPSHVLRLKPRKSFFLYSRHLKCRRSPITGMFFSFRVQHSSKLPWVPKWEDILFSLLCMVFFFFSSVKILCFKKKDVSVMLFMSLPWYVV